METIREPTEQDTELREMLISSEFENEENENEWNVTSDSIFDIHSEDDAKTKGKGPFSSSSSSSSSAKQQQYEILAKYGSSAKYNSDAKGDKYSKYSNSDGDGDGDSEDKQSSRLNNPGGDGDGYFFYGDDSPLSL
jgi:hypothetical protein